MRCLRHDYDWSSYRFVRDVSFGEPGVLLTEFSGTCRSCGKPRTKQIRGRWEPPARRSTPSQGRAR